MPGGWSWSFWPLGPPPVQPSAATSRRPPVFGRDLGAEVSKGVVFLFSCQVPSQLIIFGVLMDAEMDQKGGSFRCHLTVSSAPEPARTPEKVLAKAYPTWIFLRDGLGELGAVRGRASNCWRKAMPEDAFVSGEVICEGP